MKWFKKNDVHENGYSLFLYFCTISCIVFISSLSYFNSDLFLNSITEILFTLLTTFFNPFYILAIIFLLFYPLYKLLPRLLFKPVLFVFTGAFFTYLYVEKWVFNQFKFHTNSFVLKILQQPDVFQVLGIGVLEIVMILLAILLGVILAWAIYGTICRTPLPNWLSNKLHGKIRKLAFIFLIFLVFTIDKTAYAWYLYNKNIAIYLLANDVPLYIPSQMGTYFRDMGFEPPASDKPSLKLIKNRVNYPLEPYHSTVKDQKKLPNIILLMADALRPDMIDPDIMPAVYRFSKEKAINFKRHYSGSNGTTQALFSLFYGLPSRYMDFFSRGEVSPIIFDALLENNYQLALYSSKSLGWLGTDHLVFFKVKKYIVDELHPDSIKSDAMVNQRALKTIAEHSRQSEKPLFLMVFYDSPHLPHFKNKKFKKFVPDNPSLIFDPRSAEDRRRGLNEYRNAANYVDHLMAGLLEKLEVKGYFENSIIYITSDHGSEKYEHGHWGHASAFTNEQLQVPSLLYYPGSKPQEVTRMTSHADVVSTLMELMGETYDSRLHTLGQSLLDASPRDYIIADGMANRVLIDTEYKINYTPFEGVSYYEVTDAEDNPVPNPDEIIARYTPKILKMFGDFQKFLK